MFLKGGARKGPTWRETLLMHAVARLVLNPFIRNIQASWVKMGPDGAAEALHWIVLLRDRLIEVSDDAIHAFLIDGQKQSVLGRHMEVDRPRRNVRDLCDVPHGGGVVAALGEKDGGSVLQGRPAA